LNKLAVYVLFTVYTKVLLSQLKVRSIKAL